MSTVNMESIEPKNLYSQALTALVNGQLVEARNLFSNLITSIETLPPEEIDAVLLSQAYVGLGDVEVAEEQSDAAFEQYRKALDLFSSLPEELTPEFQRAALYVGQGYAAEKVRQMIEADDRLDLRYCLALIHLERGNIDSAATELEAAIQKNSENAQLKEDLHNLLCHQVVVNAHKENWEGAHVAIKKLLNAI